MWFRISLVQPLVFMVGNRVKTGFARNGFGIESLCHNNNYMASTQEEVLRSVDVFPLSQHSALPQDYKHVKVIHFIRHAEGQHNVHRNYNDVCNFDARLTFKGIEQCEAFSMAMKWERSNANSSVKHQNHSLCDLIVTSTLTRCLQTAELCFPNLRGQVPWVANDLIRETVNHICDKRRPISEVSAEFPFVDFANVKEDEDELWNRYETRLGPHWTNSRESAELYQVANRGRMFVNWLCQRAERNVVVCSHSAFFRCIVGWGQAGGVYRLPAQTLDDRHEPKPDIPIFNYFGDESFEQQMRADFRNCELRSFVIAYN